jgi:hypothetical protein
LAEKVKQRRVEEKLSSFELSLRIISDFIACPQDPHKACMKNESFA